MTEADIPQLYSPNTEAALLAALIIDPAMMRTIEIDQVDFTNISNREIFAAMETMQDSAQGLDYITLCGELDKRGQLKAIGRDYITGLLAVDAFTYNAPTYARTLRDKTQRRRLHQVANDLMRAVIDQSHDIGVSLPGIINAISSAASTHDGAVHITKYLSTLYDETAVRSQNPTDVWGIPTGFQTFDEVTGGLQQSELMIVSGEPGVGKSMWVMQAAAQMAESAPGAIYSMEMTGESVARRLISWKSRIPAHDIKTGRLQDWTGFCGAVEVMERLPIYMSDSSGWTTTSLRADIARMKVQYGVRWFVLDYLYLLNDGFGQSETERTTLASKGLKRICRELDVSGVAVHSMNKPGIAGAGNGAPTNDNLRGSGQVIYDADVIVFLTMLKESPPGMFIRPEELLNIRELHIKKGREIEGGSKRLWFIKLPGYPAFGEYKK